MTYTTKQNDTFDSIWTFVGVPILKKFPCKGKLMHLWLPLVDSFLNYTLGNVLHIKIIWR